MRGRRALADVICYCRMTSDVALDCVTSFLCLKDVTYLCKHMRHSSTIGGNSYVQWRKVEVEDFKCVFVVYLRIESYFSAFH